MIAKFDLARLPVKILKRLPVHLLKQFAVQVELDSLWYWALTHDIVMSPAGSVFEQWPLKETFTTLLAAHCAKLGYAARDSVVDRLNKVIYEVISEPVKELITNKDVIVMYLCFPVLEGLVKFAMSPVIDLNGQVKVSSDIMKKQFRIGQKVSSLVVLLRALEANASTISSDPDLALNLKDFRLQVESIAASSQILPPYIKSGDGWDTIYYLRNVTLHGTKGAPLRSGLLTNLICLIVWHLMDEKAVSKELHNIATRPRNFKFPKCYYPPEL